NGLLITLCCSHDRFLWGPIKLGKEAADVCWMITDAELLFDESSYAAASPHSTAKAEGFSALCKQAEELSTLVYAEQRHGARSRVVPQSLHAMQRGSLQPLADRSLSDAQGLRDLLLCCCCVHPIWCSSQARRRRPSRQLIGRV